MLDDIFKKSGIKMSEICIIYFLKFFMMPITKLI